MSRTAEIRLQKEIDKLKSKIKSLRAALSDCMSYTDIDNLTMQTKHRRWQAVLDGAAWNPSNLDVEC
jgi:hypothetical protein